jgi:hypothetical protein
MKEEKKEALAFELKKSFTSLSPTNAISAFGAGLAPDNTTASMSKGGSKKP